MSRQLNDLPGSVSQELDQMEDNTILVAVKLDGKLFVEYGDKEHIDRIQKMLAEKVAS